MKFTRVHALTGRIISKIFTLLVRGEFSHFERSLVWWDCIIQNPQYMKIIGTTVRSGSWLYAVTGDSTGQRFSPHIEIGEGCYLGHHLHLTAVQSVVIEPKVMIADFVYISDNFHDYRDIDKPIQEQRVFSRGGTRVREGAFIGEGARIIGPVTVGKNAVIGANAVVTRDIPDNSVALGIPAKVVRQYDSENRVWITV